MKLLATPPRSGRLVITSRLEKSTFILPPSSFILNRAFILAFLPREFLVKVLTADTENARCFRFVSFSSVENLLHILRFHLRQREWLLDSLLDPHRKLNRLRVEFT